MDSPALVALPLLLGIVLTVSAIAKLRERDSTATAIRLLRLPKVLAHPVVPTLLPIGELVLVATMFAPWSWLVGLAALAGVVLFVAYWVVIARALRFDPAPDCGCFGRIGNQTVTPRTLLRNTVLVAVAVLFALWAWSGHTAWTALARFTLTDLWWLVLAGIAVWVGVLIVATPAPKASAHPRLPEPPTAASDDPDEYVRVAIPAGTVQAPTGEVRLLAELAVPRAQVLVFTTCGCGSTARSLERLPAWRQQLAPLVDVIPITTDRRHDPAEGDPVEAWYDHGGLSYRALGLSDTPAAVLLGADGLVAGGPVAGVDEIEQFVTDIAEALRGAQPAPSPDDAAPAEPVPSGTAGAPAPQGDG